MARGVEGVEGEALVGPVGEEFDEVATVEVILYRDGEELGDACPGDAGSNQGMGVGEQEAAGGLDGEDLSAAVKLPFEGRPVTGIAKLEADVAGIRRWVWRGVRVLRGRTARLR